MLIRPNVALSRTANLVLAGLPERCEVFFHAEEDAAGARARVGTLLFNIRLAGFTYGRGLYERAPAAFMEVPEMRLDARREEILRRLCGVAEPCHVPRASRDDGDILRESRGDGQQEQQCQSQRPCHVDSESWHGDQCMTELVHDQIGRCKLPARDKPAN
jgi:hypothetical protein